MVTNAFGISKMRRRVVSPFRDNRDGPVGDLNFPPATVSLIENFGAFEVEAETDFRQSSVAHGMAQASLVFRVEHEKAAATCSDNFSAQRAIRHRAIVPGIDVLVAHAL